MWADGERPGECCTCSQFVSQLSSLKEGELDPFSGQKSCLTFALEEDIFFVILDRTQVSTAVEGDAIYLPGLKT